MSYYYPPTRVAKMKKMDNTKYYLTYPWWEWKSVQLLYYLVTSTTAEFVYTAWWLGISIILQGIETVKIHQIYAPKEVQRRSTTQMPTDGNMDKHIVVHSSLHCTENDELPHMTWVASTNIMLSKSHKGQAQSSKPGKLICGDRSQDNRALGSGCL